jgi:hypothetical protein
LVATSPDDRLRAKNSAPPPGDRYHVQLELSDAQQGVGGFPTDQIFFGGLEQDSTEPTQANSRLRTLWLAGPIATSLVGSDVDYRDRFDRLKTKTAYAMTTLAESGESHPLNRQHAAFHQSLIFFQRI